MNSATLFNADENKAFPSLRYSKVSGVQDFPITIIPQASKALMHLAYRLPAVVRCESDYIFNDQGFRAKVVHEIGELLKQIVACVIF